MLFNSFAFAAFLPVVFLLYWSLQRYPLRAQNLLVVVASYIFYGWWDYRFAGLLALSSSVDFLIGLRLQDERRPRHRSVLLGVSLVVNLGILGFFKYFNFFADSAVTLLHSVGFAADPVTLSIVLPVGVSFYTLQELGYIFDVYRGTIRGTRDPVAFFAFVAFFPQLVAGPIERAGNLLPQVERRRYFDPVAAHDGLRQMLWGFVKKVVVADNLAGPVSTVFAAPGSYDRLSLSLAAIGFAIQLYCDFSGYSEIAIGSARLFGFSIMRNFAHPYFAGGFRDFWRRWHISLSTWFRDYVYEPLGGPRQHRARNILVVFLLSGLWHGARWNFVMWGFLNGLYYFAFPVGPGGKVGRVASALVVSGLYALSLVFFRAESWADAMSYFQGLLGPQATGAFSARSSWALVLAAVVLGWEWWQRHRPHAMEIARWSRPARWTMYVAVTCGILLFGAFNEQPFIYFQF